MSLRSRKSEGSIIAIGGWPEIKYLSPECWRMVLGVSKMQGVVSVNDRRELIKRRPAPLLYQQNRIEFSGRTATSFPRIMRALMMQIALASY
jgi:hypothetical protein